MKLSSGLVSDRSASAAAEMALVLPILLVVLFGSLELGNYFRHEHILVKAVRDGARFAARQDFLAYEACTGEPTGTVVEDTRNVVRTGLVTGGTARLTDWDASTIDVAVSCSTKADTETLAGIYQGRTTGAPIVTVSASVPYTPLIGAFVFSGAGQLLNASQQAAVTGI